MAKIKAGRKKFTMFDITISVIMTILDILVIVPFWNAIVISFSTNEFYVNNRFALWPGDFTWSNYVALFERGSGLITAYGNTIWVSIIGTVGGMVVMTMAAYAFSRRFPGRRILFMILRTDGSLPHILTEHLLIRMEERILSFFGRVKCQ